MSDEIELPDEVDESEREAWDAYVAYVGVDYATGDDFREAYAGEWDSVEDYVESTFRDCYDVPEELTYYVDWKLMARDWENGGDIWTDGSRGGNMYVFRSV